MTLFDWILLVMVIGGAYLGYRRGIIAQAGAVVGVVAGIVLCQAFASTFADSFNEPGDSAQTRLMHTVMTYVLIFMTAYVGSRILSGFFKAAVRTLHLRTADRFAGAVFKVLEWVLLYSMFLNFWLMIMPESDVRSTRSSLTTAVLNFAPTVLGSETARQVMEATSSAAESLKPDTVPADTASVSQTAAEIVAGRVISSATK